LLAQSRMQFMQRLPAALPGCRLQYWYGVERHRLL
jgi:hypothetical protein